MNGARFRQLRAAGLMVALAITALATQDRSARTLDIYLVDVEEGNAGAVNRTFIASGCPPFRVPLLITPTRGLMA